MDTHVDVNIFVTNLLFYHKQFSFFAKKYHLFLLSIYVSNYVILFG